MFYAPSIFKTQFPDDALALTFTAVGAWNFISVFLSFFLVDRFNRKSLLIVTLTLMTIGTLMLGFTDKDDPLLPTIAKYVSVVAVMLFVGAFECGIGPLFWMMAVEAYPAHIKDAACSFTNAAVWTCNIMLSFCFPLVSQAMGASKTFFLLSAIGAVSTLLVFWSVRAAPRASLLLSLRGSADCVRALCGVGVGGSRFVPGGGDKKVDDDDLLINDSSFRDLGESEDEDDRDLRKFQ